MRIQFYGGKPCFLFHRWLTEKDNGFTKYQRCLKCGGRRIIQPDNSGYQPVDYDYLSDFELESEKRECSRVPEEMKQKAAEFLKANIPLDDQKEIKKEIKDKGKDWIVPYHFHWGMAIRNLLRQNGFGEDDLGISNLDFIYVQLVERAIIGGELG